MPTFNPRFRAEQVPKSEVITEFMKGRAMALAYQTEKQQQLVRQEELEALMYGNRPDVRARQEEAAKANLENTRARTGMAQAQTKMMERPPKPTTIAGEFYYWNWDPAQQKYIKTDVPVPAKGGGQTIEINTVGIPPTPSRMTKLQETMDVTAAGYQRLKRINDSYDDVYSTLPGKAKGGWAAIRETLGADLSETDKKYLTDYTDWQTRTINNLNDHIRAITGAQLSKHEADRISKGMPNLDDSPTQFRAKINAVMEELQLSHARAHWVMRNGYSDAHLEAVTLDQMQGMIEQRGQALKSLMVKENPGVSEAEIDAVIRKTLREEFGL